MVETTRESKMKKIITEPEYYFYKYGMVYTHYRGNWLFYFGVRFNGFKLGADWDISRFKIQEIEIHLGFINICWTRIK